jgi:uracil-DNA glycosylase
MQASIDLVARFRALAEGLPGLDMPTYASFDRDPLEPVLGLGSPTVPLCVFGRDPGREEIAAGKPFMGAAGRPLRQALSRFTPASNGSVDDGLPVFWLSTVPYKRVANKAWPASVIRAFSPLIGELMLEHWQGIDVITLGNHAFHWFMQGQTPIEQQRLAAFWASERRYTETIDVRIGDEKHGRRLRLHPLPHPSPANAQWQKRFPELLERRLSEVLGPVAGTNRPPGRRNF